MDDRFVAYMTLKDPRAALDLYEKALPNTKRGLVLDGPDGSVMHAEMTVNGALVFMSGKWPGMAEAHEGISPVNFMIRVPNADEAYAHATANGLESVMEPADQFYGERSAAVRDPFGFRWTFMHRVEELSEDEIRRRADAFMKEMAAQG